jgi:hypothetical protein
MTATYSTLLRPFYIISLLLSISYGAKAVTTVGISDWVPQAKLVGQARMTYLFWDVYDARLYAADGQWQASAPFALELSYLRDLEGKAIAKRSVEEIRKQGFTDEATLARWYQQLSRILPNVKNGTRLTGVVDQQQITRFYLDGLPLAEVNDPLFSTWFFNIWLSEATSEPKLRAQLLGEQS